MGWRGDFVPPGFFKESELLREVAPRIIPLIDALPTHDQHQRVTETILMLPRHEVSFMVQHGHPSG